LVLFASKKLVLFNNEGKHVEISSGITIINSYLSGENEFIYCSEDYDVNGGIFKISIASFGDNEDNMQFLRIYE